MPQCQNCGKSEKLSKCAGCGKSHYCSNECQKTDWTIHREYCIGKNEPRGSQPTVFDFTEPEVPFVVPGQKGETPRVKPMPSSTPPKISKDPQIQFIRDYLAFKGKSLDKFTEWLKTRTFSQILSSPLSPQKQKKLMKHMVTAEDKIFNIIKNSDGRDFSKAYEIREYVFKTLRLAGLPESCFVQDDEKDFEAQIKFVNRIDVEIDRCVDQLREPVVNYPETRESIPPNSSSEQIADILAKNTYQRLAEEIVPDIKEDNQPRYVIVDGKITEISAAELNKSQRIHREKIINDALKERKRLMQKFARKTIGKFGEEVDDDEPISTPPVKQSKAPESTILSDITSMFETVFPFAGLILTAMTQRAARKFGNWAFAVPILWGILLLSFVGYTMGEPLGVNIHAPRINQNILQIHTNNWNDAWGKWNGIVQQQNQLTNAMVSHTRNQIAAMEGIETSRADLERLLRTWDNTFEINQNVGKTFMELYQIEGNAKLITNTLKQYWVDQSYVKRITTNKPFGTAYQEFVNGWLGNTGVQNLDFTKQITDYAVTQSKALPSDPTESHRQAIILLERSKQEPIAIGKQLDYTSIERFAYAIRERLGDAYLNALNINPYLYSSLITDIQFTKSALETSTNTSNQVNYAKSIQDSAKRALSEFNLELPKLGYDFETHLHSNPDALVFKQKSTKANPSFINHIVNQSTSYFGRLPYWKLLLADNLDKSGYIYDISTWASEMTTSMPYEDLLEKSSEVLEESLAKQRQAHQKLRLEEESASRASFANTYWGMNYWISKKFEGLMEYAPTVSEFIPMGFLLGVEVVNIIRYNTDRQSWIDVFSEADEFGVKEALMLTGALAHAVGDIWNTLYAVEAGLTLSNYLYSTTLDTKSDINIIMRASNSLMHMTGMEWVDPALGILAHSAIGISTTTVLYFKHTALMQIVHQLWEKKHFAKKGLVLGSLATMMIFQNHDHHYVPSPYRTSLKRELVLAGVDSAPLNEVIPSFTALLQSDFPAIAQNINAVYNANKWLETDAALQRLVDQTFTKIGNDYENVVKLNENAKFISTTIVRQTSVSIPTNVENLASLLNEFDGRLKEFTTKQRKALDDEQTRREETRNIPEFLFLKREPSPASLPNPATTISPSPAVIPSAELTPFSAGNTSPNSPSSNDDTALIVASDEEESDIQLSENATEP